MAKFSAYALGALLFGGSTMLSVTAFAGLNHRKSAVALKMVRSWFLLFSVWRRRFQLERREKIPSCEVFKGSIKLVILLG